MLAVWGWVEADLRRDYGLELTEALPRMSWRTFKVLLDGLSPCGALAAHYREALDRQRMEEDDGRDAAAAFWNRMAAFRPREA